MKRHSPFMMIIRSSRYLLFQTILLSCTLLPGAQTDLSLNLDADQQVMASEGLSNNYNQLQISGFATGGYLYQLNTRTNTFRGNKIAVSFFKPVNTSLYFFGQLTTALEDGESGTEIDNLLVSYTPASCSRLTLMGGKFDAPVGFERDDEPLNFLPDNSFNFALARPVKYTGISALYTMNPAWDLTGYVVNGWDLNIDNNHQKTVGSRLGFSPGEHYNFGFSLISDFPGPGPDHPNRLLTDVDYTLQPGGHVLLAGEINYGTRRNVGGTEPSGSWSGGQITLYSDITHRTGLAVRYDVFQDTDGLRTGQRQTLQSISLAPTFRLDAGQFGAFTTREHTNVSIPAFELRMELRENHSSLGKFPDGRGGLSQWSMVTQLQAVAVF